MALSAQGADLNTSVFPPYAAWLERTPGSVLACVWGFAEGSLFFILPDVLLSFTAFFRPRRAVVHMAAIMTGAVLAGAVMFSWSARSPAARDAVAHVPAVTPAMFERAERDLREYGVAGTTFGPARGIPYKVYAVEAPGHSTFLPFLLWTIPARLWRFAAVWLGFGAAGMLLRKLGRIGLAPAVHAVFWIVTYAVYWTTVK